MTITNEDYLLSSYNYYLPEELIAKYPVPRGQSRLLVKTNSDLIDAQFSELINFLPANSVLVANNSKVLPARLTGHRQTGGLFEFLLLTPWSLIKDSQTMVSCLLKPGKAFRLGQIIELCPGLQAEIVSKGEFGQHQVYLHWADNLEHIFVKYGNLPLPPYLKRSSEPQDYETYQTIYAQKSGSVAAPTAGLHFTPELKTQLEAAGHTWLELTLHVGYGTFSPVRATDIRAHQLHEEFVELNATTAAHLRAAKAAGRPIIGIGTTTVRSLEGIALKQGSGHLESHLDWLNCFIYPGHEFKIIDGLITNFHLPESSLLMLVSALVGRAQTIAMYEQAVQKRYRFFSYGDAMLVMK